MNFAYMFGRNNCIARVADWSGQVVSGIVVIMTWLNLAIIGQVLRLDWSRVVPSTSNYCIKIGLCEIIKFVIYKTTPFADMLDNQS